MEKKVEMMSVNTVLNLFYRNENVLKSKSTCTKQWHFPSCSVLLFIGFY